jgi:Flp pilus assembly protein TadD
VNRKAILAKAGMAALAAAGVVALGGAVFGLRQWLSPRTIGVCVVTDYSVRQNRPNWQAALDARFAAVNRIFGATPVRWAFRHAGEPDPTGSLHGMEERRTKLFRTQCQADVILGVTGQPESRATVDAPAFSHLAMVVDDPRLSDEQNARVMAHGLARLFGAPVDAAGSGTLMTAKPESDTVPKPVVKLMGAVRAHDFARGAAALDGAWADRVYDALAGVNTGRGNPAAAAHRTMGLALAADELYPAAIRHLAEVVKIEPNDAKARIELAAVYGQNFQWAEAASEYRAAVRLQPNAAPNRAALGLALANSGNGEAAIEELRQALRLDPRHAPAQAALAYILSQQLGRIDEAIAEYRTAVAMDAKLPAATAGLERAVAFKQRSLEEAAQRRQKASTAAELFDLGLAEARAGNVDGAAKTFRRAIDLDRNNPRAHANLAMLLYLQKDYSGALREAQTASQEGFDPPPALIETLKRRSEK